MTGVRKQTDERENRRFKENFEQRSAARKYLPGMHALAAGTSHDKVFISLPSFAHCQLLLLFQVCWSVMGRQIKENSGRWLPAKPAGGDAGKEKGLLFPFPSPSPPTPAGVCARCNLEVFKRPHFSVLP